MIAQNVRALRATGHATFEMIHMTKDRWRIPVEISAHLSDFKGKTQVGNGPGHYRPDISLFPCARS
jgi:hypothetical protein